MARNSLCLFIVVLAVGLGPHVVVTEPAVPDPTIVGPILSTVAPGDASHQYTYFSSPLVDDFDYVEEEYFINGVANVYDTPPLETGTVVSSGHPYRTRMVVRRPRQAARFNGTVILEWLNVTAGFDFEALWLSGSGAGLMRAGYVWIGVSVQMVGVHAPTNGLRDWSPVRYGMLDVTAGGAFTQDELSYDIFSQAGQAVMQPVGVGVLGGLQPRRLIASGSSQSGHFLGTYYNAIQPLSNRFDGFVILVSNPTVRADLDVPVFKVQGETEAAAIAAGVLPPLQPDSAAHWTWQLAGTSHVDRVAYDNGYAISIRDAIPIVVPLGVCALPELSHVPFHHSQTVAFDHLVRWIDTGLPPPGAPLIATAGGAVVRDATGLAVGGVRLAALAVPTALNTGVNAGPAFCRLLGSHQPFTPETLAALYPTHGTYVEAVQSVTRDNLAAGFVTPHDARETVADAARSAVGR